MSPCCRRFGRRDRFALGWKMPRGADWANYDPGVAVELIHDEHRLLPLDLAIAGDVPLGGLSSSAFLEVAVDRRHVVFI